MNFEFNYRKKLRLIKFKSHLLSKHNTSQTNNTELHNCHCPMETLKIHSLIQIRNVCNYTKMQRFLLFSVMNIKNLNMSILGLALFFFFFLITYNQAIFAQTINKQESFSPLEVEMDLLANQYRGKNDVVLEKINLLDQKISSINDFSVLNAYRCFLSSRTKNTILFQRTLAELKKKEIQTARDLIPLAAIQSAISLCDYYNEPDVQKRERILAKAYHFVKSSQAPTLRYWISITYSELISRQGRARDAIAAATIALSVARTNNDIRRQAESLKLLAMMEVDYDDKENALLHINEAINLRSTLSDKSQYTEYLLNRAFILTQVKDYQAAMKAYREIETLAIKENLQSILPIVWSNYADIAYLQGKYAKAQKEVNHLLNWSHQNNDDPIRNYAKITGALLATENKDVNKAEQFFNEGIAYFEQEKSYVEMRDFYHSYATALARNGFYKQAFSALAKKGDLNQQIDLESRGNAVGELHEVLKTEEREKENIFLLAEIERNKLSNQRWGFLAAFLFLGLMWLSQLIIQSKRRNSLLKLENAELDTERYQDPLTLLYNRRYIIKNRVAIWQKAIQQKAATLIIDADHFKRINDEHGHAAGDAALIEIARRIKLSVRESDIVVRWGGEEFVVFSFACNAEQVQTLAKRIIEELRLQPLYFEDKIIPLSVSIGYVLLPLQIRSNEYVDLEDSVKLADAALYLAKARGRNRAIGVLSLISKSSKVSELVESLQLMWDKGKVNLVEILGPTAKP